MKQRFLKHLRRLALPTLAALAVAGCTLPSATQRTDAALALAADAGWQTQRIEAGRFSLLAAARPWVGVVPHEEPSSHRLAIFIEGDGLAWIDPRTPSEDPTPREPIALKMALAETHLPAAYLGRPCQYASDPARQRCNESDWTDARFSPEIVAAMDTAVDGLKRRSRARELVLVGYSGGGAIASLLAASRNDVALLVTVAAVLDTDRWTQMQQVAPLRKSMNPRDFTSVLQHVPQVHLVGTSDRQTGPSAIAGYVDGFASTSRPEVIEVAGFDHSCCWATAWRRLSPLGRNVSPAQSAR